MDYQIVNKYKQILRQENKHYNVFKKLSDRLEQPNITYPEKKNIQSKIKLIKKFLRRNSTASGRVPTDYEIRLQKKGDQGHFIDHKGNFITCTGHMVDDFANPTDQVKITRKGKVKNESPSSKNDISRKFFPTNKQIINKVKKEHKLVIDI